MKVKVAHGGVKLATKRVGLRLREDVLIVLDLPLDFNQADVETIMKQLRHLVPPEKEED